MFRDRSDAGRQLAQRLLHLKDQQPPPGAVVLGLPRGGVIVASEIARELNAPLDVLVVRKIGAPHQPELAIGAVTDGQRPQVVLNQELVDALGVSQVYLNAEIAEQYMEVRRREQFYRGGRKPPPITGRTVIVVDDGIATGATVKAGLEAIRRLDPARLILAVPVAAPESLDQLRDLADEIVVLAAPANFVAVGRFYSNFDQTTDEEVIALLEEAA
ncbi:MAG: phosphoribosyltransferase, partial [Phycisphaerales bacterium]|nr:phosphoribosyltransferase [Phycisphaerales bacterium]